MNSPNELHGDINELFDMECNYPIAIKLLKDACITLKTEGYGCREIENFLNSLKDESNK